MERNPLKPFSGAAGYSLMEMIIAVTLSAIVISGIISVGASVIRFQMEGAARGDVAGWTLMNLHRLNQELESATYLSTRTANVVGTSPLIAANALVGCLNYSAILGGRYVTAAGAAGDVTWFYYCPATVPAEPSLNAVQSLYRYSKVGSALTCPDNAAIASITCGSPAGGLTMEVVARKFYHHNRVSGTPPFFIRYSTSPGIEMHFTIGDSSRVVAGVTSTNRFNPNPVFLQIDTVIGGSNRSFNNYMDDD